MPAAQYGKTRNVWDFWVFKVGINVEGKEVFYTEEHQQLVDTSVEKNPFSQITHGIPVRSVFRRRTASNNDKGDGNPLIYALKRSFGWRIQLVEVLKFMPNLRCIVQVAMQEEPYDAIVALPSSHPIAGTLAKIAGRYQREAVMHFDIFEKCTNAEVAQGLQADLQARLIPSKDRRGVTSLIHSLGTSPDQLFSLKLVDNHLRGYTNPFKLTGIVSFADQRVLIVDDLLSSGTSLSTAGRLIIQAGAQRVSALCLLSSLGKGKPRT